MRTTIKKVFWAWEFEKEEVWLNEMAAKGLCLVSVGFCRYEFEDCQPGEYGIRIELLEHKPNHPESVKYLEFLEGTGAEQVGSWMKWVYFRKKKADGAFELFSDNPTRIKHLSRVMHLLLVLSLLNLLVGAYNLVLCFAWDSALSAIGTVNIILGIFAMVGYAKLRKKRSRLKEEQQLFE